MPEGDGSGELHTDISRVELHRILIRGHDLTGELVGSATFAELVSLMLAKRLPTADEARMLDALLIILAEHGVQPTLPARLTYYQAPESVQGAVAAALLGAGSKHLGTSEQCARMLQAARPPADDPAAITALAVAIVDDHVARHAFIPGIGHRTHGEGDPRAVRLFEVARETGQHGGHCLLLEEISRLAEARLQRQLAVNVTGAIGAIASDMGYRWEIAKAFALIGRTLGALAHIQEEMDRPLHPTVKAIIDRAVVYDGDA